MKYFAAQQSKWYPLFHFCCSTQHFYIVDSYIYSNNNKMERTVVFPWQQSLRERATM
jgi:hypothetical protein